MLSCFMCHAALSNDEYNFSSLVSSNTTIETVFFNVINDIASEVRREDISNITEFSNLKDADNIPICALCFKRFCDYDRFSIGLKDLKTSFQKDIETKLNKKFLSSEQLLLTKSVNAETNKENERKIDIDNRRRISSRKRKMPSRFALNKGQSTEFEDDSLIEDISRKSCPNDFGMTDRDKSISKKIEHGTKHEYAVDSNISLRLNNSKDREGFHQGEKKFQCDICQKGFTRKASMQEHVDRHQGSLYFE